MPSHQRLHRASRLSSTLERNGYPRLTMLMIVGGAGVAAFLSSALMLAAGVRYMPVRYAIASLLGYAVFVWLVRGWLEARDRREANQRLVENTVDAVDVMNVTDLPGAVVRTVGRTAREAPVEIFQGGRSGGAGASAAFGDGPSHVPAMVVPSVPSESGGHGPPISTTTASSC